MASKRESMLTGEKHPACQTCWKIEEGGGTSYRLYSKPDDTLDDDDNDGIDFSSMVENPELVCIDFGFGENCNLRCRMCQPGLSNKLRKDYRYFILNDLNTTGIVGFDYNTDPIDDDMWRETDSEHEVFYWPDDSFQWKSIMDNIHTLRKIRATGGETTISKPFIEFLDKAIEKDVAKQISLDFHTNATKFTDELIDKLLQFRGMYLHFSIDSFGKNYEYIRYPMTWKALDASVLNLLDKTSESTAPVKIQFTIVISALNAFNIAEIYQYYAQLRKKYYWVTFDFWIDFLWPEEKFINIKFLSRELKHELIDYLKDTFDYTRTSAQYSHIISFLETNLSLEITDKHRQDMLREIRLFDKSRKQNYRDYLDPRVCTFLETPIK
jgi:MoaA/NifB/PqqE/SkfB family radical SAM enzyme